MADRPRLVPVLSVAYWVPTHWRLALPAEGHARTTWGYDYGRAVDYASRDGRTLERFGRAGLRIATDCYGRTIAR